MAFNGCSTNTSPKKSTSISAIVFVILIRGRLCGADTPKKDACLKKNQNAPRPSEHPPVRGEKCQNV